LSAWAAEVNTPQVIGFIAGRTRLVSGLYAPAGPGREELARLAVSGKKPFAAGTAGMRAAAALQAIVPSSLCDALLSKFLSDGFGDFVHQA